MTTYTPRPKWGSIILIFGTIILVFSGIFVLRNEKEITTTWEREKLTPAEIVLVAQEQYKIEQSDRLKEVNSLKDSISQLKASNLQQRELINELSQRVTVLEKSTIIAIKNRETTSSSKQKKATSAVVYDSLIQKATVAYLNKQAHSLNLLNPKYDATVIPDSTGKWNILYYSIKQKRYTYYLPTDEKSLVQ
jgi:hypothetical protein